MSIYNPKYRALIIEDEQNARNLLKHMLMKVCPQVVVVSEAATLEEARKAIALHHPDLLFMDIHLPDGTCFELLQSSREKNFQVIFVTSYDMFYINALKFSALDYLVKPISEEALCHAIHKLENYGHLKAQCMRVLLDNKDKIEKIIVPDKDGLVFINVADIVRCEADGNYTWFYMNNNSKTLITLTLGEFEDVLESSGFFRIHKSHIINLAFLKKYKRGDGGSVIMADGTEIEVSRRRKEAFLFRLQQLSK